jgi:hypothetical protein
VSTAREVRFIEGLQKKVSGFEFQVSSGENDAHSRLVFKSRNLKTAVIPRQRSAQSPDDRHR